MNGSKRVGLYYRLLVPVVNVFFATLSGLSPLLVPETTPAYVQTSCVLGLQLMMALICLCVAPDADRVISFLAGVQFLFEAASTASLLLSSVMQRATGAGVATTDATALYSAFWLGLVAVAVPMVQLLEQRLITPAITTYEKKGGNPLALLATFYMLASSLPRQIIRLVTTADGMDDVQAASASDGATADAGDDADANETEANGEADEAVYSVEQAGETVARSAKLLARGMAAKEVSSKSLVAPSATTDQAAVTSAPPDEPEGDVSGQLHAGALQLRGMSRWHASSKECAALRVRTDPDDAKDDEADEADDGDAGADVM